MGGCRCSFRNCKSATKTHGDLHFFHYPVKHKERCKEWIKNARKAEFLKLPDDQLRNKVICDLHFEQWFFTNALRKRLVHNAVPTLATGCEESEYTNGNGGEFQNVEVIPANEDGTIFTLDTDTLQNKVDDSVNTYSFKNGTLVPVYENDDNPDQPQEQEIVYTLQPNDEDFNVVPNYENQSNESNFLFNTGEGTENYEIVFNGDDAKSIIDKKSSHNVNLKAESFENMNVVYVTECAAESSAGLSTYTTTNKMIVDTEEEVDSSDDIKPDYGNRIKKGRVNKQFLKQVNRNSREIESLKRAVMCSQRASKPDINFFKEKVPPTLFGAFTVCLNKKMSNFSKQEEEFLTKMYMASPECYRFLSEDLEWQLPPPTVVERLINTSDL